MLRPNSALLSFASLAIGSVLWLSCGGSSQNPVNTPAGGSTVPSAPVSQDPSHTGAPPGTPTLPSSTTPGAPPAVNWTQMSRAQRLEHMKTVVLPKMKAEFAAFDSSKFDKFSCGTCHGSGAHNGSFKMPNPDLPKLSVEGGFKKHMDSKPEITRFMMTKVAPDMASMLGEPPYDPKTHQGFGCFGCHTMEK